MLQQWFFSEISVLDQSICIFKAGLSSLSDDWERYKEKVPGVSDFNQNVEIPWISNLTYTEIKRFIHEKRAEKLVKGEFWAILKSHFRLSVFASTGEYFYCWHQRVLPKVLQGNDANTFKKLVVSFYTLYSHKSS